LLSTFLNVFFYFCHVFYVFLTCFKIFSGTFFYIYGTNWLVSTDSVSSYPASMVNFIWFTDEKCSSCQHLVRRRHKIRCLAIQKLIHLVSGVCWCTVLLEGAKVKLSPQMCESDRFGRFCSHNVKTSTVCHQ